MGFVPQLSSIQRQKWHVGVLQHMMISWNAGENIIGSNEKGLKWIGLIGEYWTRSLALADFWLPGNEEVITRATMYSSRVLTSLHKFESMKKEKPTLVKQMYHMVYCRFIITVLQNMDASFHLFQCFLSSYEAVPNWTSAPTCSFTHARFSNIFSTRSCFFHYQLWNPEPSCSIEPSVWLVSYLQRLVEVFKILLSLNEIILGNKVFPILHKHFSSKWGLSNCITALLSNLSTIFSKLMSTWILNHLPPYFGNELTNSIATLQFLPIYSFPLQALSASPIVFSIPSQMVNSLLLTALFSCCNTFTHLPHTTLSMFIFS